MKPLLTKQGVLGLIPERTLEHPPPPTAASTRQPGCLVYVSSASSEDQGQSFRLEAGQAFIGRDASCDLTLQDSGVSRLHTKLRVTSAGIEIEDLGSTNGTYCLGKRIDKATLMPGSRLVLGDCTIDLLPLVDSESMSVSSRESYGGLRGVSLPMRRLYALLEMLENSDTPVLIQGETGTGKELVARAIHEHGLRATEPFVLIDCANVPRDLMESELFGHRKGAFTGAVAEHVGAFEAANGGTVFLDELGELPLELQPKLLRVLETGQVRRLGDVNHAQVNIRVIAASNRDLADEMSKGRFRADLYYRIAVVQLHLTPLRERREDIPVLIEHLLEQLSEGRAPQLPPEVEQFFIHQDWPGNVRELRNMVERTIALQTAKVDSPTAGQEGPWWAGSGFGVPVERQPLVATQALGCHPASHAEPTGSKPSPVSTSEASVPEEPLPKFRQARDRTKREFELDYLRRLWSRYQGNLSAAARAADIDRKFLRNLLKKHGMTFRL